MAAAQRPTRFRWIVLFLIFLAYMIAGADRANIGVVIPFIKKEFELSNTDVGAMASFFYIGYAAFQVPAGLFYEKFGVRLFFTLSFFATSFATLVMGLVTSAVQLKIARAFLGLAEAPINVGILTIINRWFPPHEKGTAVGVFMASVKFAPAVVPPLCAAIIYFFGWREVFYLFAVPGLIIAVLWFFLVPDDPRASKFCNEQEVEYIERAGPAPAPGRASAPEPHTAWPVLDRLIRAKHITPLADNRSILWSWNIWGCALGYCFLVGIAYAIMTWVPTYLINVKKFQVFQMGFVASTPWLGAIVGNIIGGYMSDKIFDKRRKPVMIITAASTIFTMYALIYSPGDPIVLASIFIVTGILLNIGYSTFLVYPMGLAAKDKVPFAAAIVNTMGSLGGAFAPFMVGLILDWYNWDIVFLFLACCSLATLVIVLTIIEPMAARPAPQGVPAGDLPPGRAVA
jgi:MFS transporter, ACS family, glucarate transporter